MKDPFDKILFGMCLGILLMGTIDHFKGSIQYGELIERGYMKYHHETGLIMWVEKNENNP